MKHVTLTLTIVALLLVLVGNNSVAQKLGEKVYWMATIEVPLGKQPDYHSMLQKEQMPAMEKYGWNFVGVWQTIVGDIENVIILAEFNDMNAYHTARGAFRGSDEWKVISRKLDEMTTNVKTAFLNAAPYSKMK
ncbi:MAG: NIPSNAP family protein [Bacteroidota bacterium]